MRLLLHARLAFPDAFRLGICLRSGAEPTCRLLFRLRCQRIFHGHSSDPTPCRFTDDIRSSRRYEPQAFFPGVAVSLLCLVLRPALKGTFAAILPIIHSHGFPFSVPRSWVILFQELCLEPGSSPFASLFPGSPWRPSVSWYFLNQSGFARSFGVRIALALGRAFCFRSLAFTSAF